MFDRHSRKLIITSHGNRLFQLKKVMIGGSLKGINTETLPTVFFKNIRFVYDITDDKCGCWINSSIMENVIPFVIHFWLSVAIKLDELPWVRSKVQQVRKSTVKNLFVSLNFTQIEQQIKWMKRAVTLLTRVFHLCYIYSLVARTVSLIRCQFLFNSLSNSFDSTQLSFYQCYQFND